VQYSTFGRTSGLRVSEYALGTANFGTSWGSGAEPAEASKLFHKFADAGGCLIDTASNYQDGQAETLLADCLASDRDHFVLGTKYGRGTSNDTPLASAGNSRRAMVQSVESSLRRLRTDRLDVLWAHYEDGVTQMDEIVHAFDALVASGKILYAGLSNFPAWRVARAVTLSEIRGWAPITGVQFEHSLIERSGERELLPMAEALGLGVALYSPLGGGLLTGKYRKAIEGRQTMLPGVVYREDSPTKTRALDAVLSVAEDLGIGPSAVAIAWQRELARRSTTTCVTVIGPRTLGQLDSYIEALDVQLDDEHYARLLDATAFSLGVPYDSIAGPPDMGDRERLQPPVTPVR
jgi:aryl-alcohol dehydrogenase-like predicted oxidoreductase